MIIEGTHVTLRPLARADAPRLVEMLANDDVRATLQLDPAPTLAEEEAFLDALPAATEQLVLGIAARDDGRLLGVCGLHFLPGGRTAPPDPGVAPPAPPLRPSRSAELGIFIGDPAEWAKGFGTEATRLLVAHAFEALGLARVTLRVFEGHARAIRAYERVGFRRERVLPRALRKDGRDVDLVEMALERAAWTEAGGGEMR